MNCLTCKVVVLRRREGIAHAAKRSHANLTWANGRQVSATARLVCPTCGGELTFDPLPLDPLPLDPLPLDPLPLDPLPLDPQELVPREPDASVPEPLAAVDATAPEPSAIGVP